MGAAMALDDPEGDIEHIRVRGDSSVKDGEFISASQGWVSGDTLIERQCYAPAKYLNLFRA